MSTTAERLEALQSRSEPPPLFRLRGRAHTTVLTAHIVTSVGWLGVALLIAVTGYLAAATGEDAYYRLMATSPWLTIPLGLAAGGTGLVLGLGTNHGVLRHWWVVAKIAIAVAVLVTDAVLVSRVAHDAFVTGDASPPVYGATTAHVVMLLVATVLSTFKPRGRTPWNRRNRS